ncbi:hypothetical protein K402DRAFT_387990 [Aulographum hederae CBS 113979]|uniref:Exosome complex protein n=1 Tax=Aulographum hederae CBS 113979 TaxID=1176131 RepID=A0A6G1HHB1_9PEZI|nr:hypothetical protein K402DRAFT_387990 [Aulographum hederae CBS 113979]
MSDVDPAEFGYLIDELCDQITDLESNLSPLLNQPLSTTASKLPLLDSAKLHVLLSYTINSLVYSSLRLSGTVKDPKEHPVFKIELARVKQHFAKIKRIEDNADGAAMGKDGKGGGVRLGPESAPGPRSRLDKAAAARFIRAGLSGQVQQPTTQSGNPLRPAVGLNFEGPKWQGQKRKFGEDGEAVEGGGDVDVHKYAEEREENRRAKVRDEIEGGAYGDEEEEEKEDVQDAPPTAADSEEKESKEAKRARKRLEKARRKEEQSNADPTTGEEPKKKRNRPDKALRDEQKKHKKSQKPPKGPTEAFQALLKRAKDKEEGSAAKG